MTSIKLFNPNDQPFGNLSNNSSHEMTINGKKYMTVTNYIYSNTHVCVNFSAMYMTVSTVVVIRSIGCD